MPRQKLTPFGIALRKIRLDAGLTLKDMALAAGVYPSYLSALEFGVRKVPDWLLPCLANKYGWSDEVLSSLKDAKDKSQPEIKVDLSGLSLLHKEVALLFSRALPSLSEEELQELIALLKSFEKRHEGEKTP